jgi:hypothetical protein
MMSDGFSGACYFRIRKICFRDLLTDGCLCSSYGGSDVSVWVYIIFGGKKPIETQSVAEKSLHLEYSCW